MKRLLAPTLLAWLILLVAALPASALIRIGTAAPSTPPTSCGAPAADLIGGSYGARLWDIRARGTITSWSTRASTDLGQQHTMKVFRKLGGAHQVVGLDGPRLLSPGVFNTFAASVQVEPGDILGINDGGTSSGCVFGVNGNHLERDGNLGMGASGVFTTASEAVNIEGQLEPSNVLTFGKVNRSKRKGTATVEVDFPGPGQVKLDSSQVRGGVLVQGHTTDRIEGAGEEKLRVRAVGRKRKQLNADGEVKVKFDVLYTPSGGSAAEQPRKLKLLKK